MQNASDQVYASRFQDDRPESGIVMNVTHGSRQYRSVRLVKINRPPEVKRERKEMEEELRDASSTSPRRDIAVRSTRKHTYQVRKQEHEELLKEAARLEQRLGMLTQVLAAGEQLYPQNDVLCDDDMKHADSTSACLSRLISTNVALQVAVDHHHLVPASILSLASSSCDSHYTMALHTPIRLGSDPRERSAVLMSIKHKKIQRAMALMDERLRSMDLTRPYSTRDEFYTSSGDHYYAILNVTPLPGVHSVSKVMQVMQFTIKNMEFIISEKLGLTTLRESEDTDHHDIVHSRMVSSFGMSVEQEMNLVAFVHCDAERDVAGLVGDSIEHDELYPYQSSCRIRRDVSPTIIVRKAAQSPKGEPVVIIQRLAFTKVHRPASPELLEGFEQVCASTAAVVDTMLSNVQELLRVAPTS